MSCDGVRFDQCIDVDEDWVTAIWLQTADLEPRSLSGFTLTGYVWHEGVLLFTLTSGDGITIGGTETCPVDERGRATGTGTRVDMEVTEAQIQALTTDQIAGPWTYKLTLSGVGDTETLLWGVVTNGVEARPR